MEIKYNRTGKDRKALVDAISDIIGEPAVYLGTPTFAYKIGAWYTVAKDGNLDIFDRADSEKVENLIEQLDKLGFTAEPRDEVELIILGVDEGSDEPEGFSIGMPISELSDKPFSEDTLNRFNDIVSGKRELFQKALGTTSKLITEREEDTLWFDWFDRMIDKEHLEIYSTFIKALYRFAENAKRVNASNKEIENEKFTMRTFLNRIGLPGDEHKALRKELMKNLSGNSAFRYGGKNDVSK
ncbi:MAG: virulence protein [bacterium]|nr:virulence protein [bacterium]